MGFLVDEIKVIHLQKTIMKVTLCPLSASYQRAHDIDEYDWLSPSVDVCQISTL